MTAQAVAVEIALAVNAVAALGVTASVVGNRVNFIGDASETPSAGLGAKLTVEGSTGRAPILAAVPGNTPNLEGRTFTLSSGGVGNFVFEFDSDTVITAGRTRVAYNFVDSAGQMARNIQSAISTNSAFTVQAFVDPADPTYGRVVVNGQQMTYSTNSPVIDLTTLLQTFQIPVEETFTAAQIGNVVANQFTGIVNVSIGTGGRRYMASADLNRLNFPPLTEFPEAPNGTRLPRTATDGLDTRAIPVWSKLGSANGVTSGHIAIPFRAEDIQATRQVANPQGPQFPPITILGLADRMANAIRAVNIPGVTVIVNGADITLDNASGSITVIIDPTPSGVPPLPCFPQGAHPLCGGGQGPGGDITGMTTTANGQIYAISNRGGLYRLNVFLSLNIPPTVPQSSVTATYIATSAPDLAGIDFSGLTAGPVATENGRYGNLLFGTTRDGRLYAFDTSGVLQPVMVDGQTSVQMHISTSIPLSSYPSGSGAGFDFANGGVQGIAFSSLDRNLWHVTPPIDPRGQTVSATAMDVRLGLAANVGDAIPFDERQLDLGHGRRADYDSSRFGRFQW